MGRAESKTGAWRWSLDGVGLMVMVVVDVAEVEERRAKSDVGRGRLRRNMMLAPSFCRESKSFYTYTGNTAKPAHTANIALPVPSDSCSHCQTRTRRVIDTFFSFFHRSVTPTTLANDAECSSSLAASTVKKKVKPISFPRSYTVTTCHTCHLCHTVTSTRHPPPPSARTRSTTPASPLQDNKWVQQGWYSL